MDLVPVFRGSRGLNNKTDPVRIKFNPDTGITDLSVGLNIDVDHTGRVSRRPGTTLVSAGAYDSVFCAGQECYISKADSVGLVNSDYSITWLAPVTGTSALPYTQFCKVNTDTFYNLKGYSLGTSKAGVYAPWPAHAYVGPDSNRQFISPPYGSHMAFSKGRMYIAEGSVLWVSEPFQVGLFDAIAGALPLGSDIRMIAPVSGGIYVSDQTDTYFIRESSGQFTLDHVATSAAVPGTLADTLVEALDLDLQTPGLCRVWASEAGVHLGMPSGIVLNLDGDRVARTDDGTRGSGAILGYKYVHSVGGQTFSTNLKSKATTKYSSTFTSLAMYNGVLLGTNTNGLCTLTGNTDEGAQIDSEFTLAKSNFGLTNIKHLRHAYLGLDASSDMTLLVSPDDGPSLSFDIPVNKLSQQASRVNLTRDTRGSYFEVSVLNKLGSDFSVDSIDILPIPIAHGSN